MHWIVILCSTLFFMNSNTTYGFFANYNISSMSTRNLTCAAWTDYYALPPWVRNVTGIIFNQTVTLNYNLCFVEYIEIHLRNGTVINTTMANPMSYVNLLQQYVERRCTSVQFSPSVTPIGYGTCNRLSFEPQTIKLCICSTNNCNVNYATCVASVQASALSPPPNLPLIVPNLTNVISCYQGYQGATYAAYYNVADWLLTEYSPLNITEARSYAASHAVACSLCFDTVSGDWYQIATTYEEYAIILYYILAMRDVQSYVSYAESSTSVAIQYPTFYLVNSSYSASVSVHEVRCFCTTNNCNRDLSTCAIGLNVNTSRTTATSSRPRNNTLQNINSTVVQGPTTQNTNPTIRTIATTKLNLFFLFFLYSN